MTRLDLADAIFLGENRIDAIHAGALRVYRRWQPLRGPDGALPVQEFDWAAQKGWIAGAEVRSVSTYLLAANGNFSRGSAASHFDADGLLRTVGANELRLDHDPATGAALGYRAEGKRTNHVAHSQALDQRGSNGMAPVIANLAPAPDGSMSADLLVPDTGGTSNHFVNVTLSLPNALQAHSVFFKAQDYPRALLRVGTASSYAEFRPDLGQSGVSSASVRAPAIQPLPDGWHRLTAGRVASSSNHVRGITPAPGEIGDSISFAGDGSSGSLFWGWMIESGAFSSSYIATAESSATRLADDLTYDLAAPETGTVLIHARTAPGAEGDQVLWQWDDGTEENCYRIVRNSDGVLHAIVAVAGINTVDLALGPVADATDIALAFAFEPGRFSACLDGNAIVTATSQPGDPPALDTLREGTDSSGNAWFGTIARIARYAAACSDGELEGMAG